MRATPFQRSDHLRTLHHRAALVARLSGLGVAPALLAVLAAAEPTPPPGDELALFADLPEVVTASRQPASLTGAAVAVSVLPAARIDHGSNRTITDVLRSVPGMDVLELDRGHAVVGIRGLAGLFSDRTLFLIDGVPYENPLEGGADPLRLPLALGDIERVEVVRGPSSAAWGANALNGVVNLITRDPAECQGTEASLGGSHHGDLWAGAATAGRMGATAWRLSASGLRLESSAKTVGADGAYGDDAVQRGTLLGEIAAPVGQAHLRAGLSYAGLKQGTYELINYDPGGWARGQTVRAHARLAETPRSGTGWSVGWYGSWDGKRDPTTVDAVQIWQSGATAQLDLDPAPGHRLSIGIDGATTRIAFRPGDDAEAFFRQGGHRDEARGGPFIMDRWTIGSGWSAELQARGERYTGTGNDWGGRASLSWDIAGDGTQVVHLAAARAYRAPYLALRLGDSDRNFMFIPGLGMVPLVQLRTDPDGLRNESVLSAEAGWAARPVPALLLRADAYAMRYHDLLGAAVSTSAGPVPVNSVTLRNDGDARAWGVELEGSWTGRIASISGWYTWQRLRTDRADQSIRASPPATHKAGLRVHAEPGAGFGCDIGWRYASQTDQDTPIGTTLNEPVSAYAVHRIDLSVARRFNGDNGEASVGCDDILDQTPQARSIGGFHPHRVPGRTLWARLDWRF
jgi:outer membrane receptor protein involved in Fe transport